MDGCLGWVGVRNEIGLHLPPYGPKASILKVNRVLLSVGQAVRPEEDAGADAARCGGQDHGAALRNAGLVGDSAFHHSADVDQGHAADAGDGCQQRSLQLLKLSGCFEFGRRLRRGS